MALTLSEELQSTKAGVSVAPHWFRSTASVDLLQFSKPDWGDPGLTLHWICLGEDTGRGHEYEGRGGQGGWEGGGAVLSAGVSSRPEPRRWTMPAYCAWLFD